ncbi:ROK family protein [Rathayibacter soli]|uniref:ROK family protein n=1 Tax=Rathayibacter soli TaxID=3144168 RepID=UPI0027E56E87|nr:ROK family protein [Glaciibacter superstes]
MTPLPRELALAVDIGGTKVDAALVSADGALRTASRHRVATGPTATREQLTAAVGTVVTAALASLTPADALIGVGIGSAGPISLTDNSISPLNLPQLAGFRVSEFVQRLVGDARVTLRLDGTCIALAEHWLGATRGIDNSMAMVVSTGVGGGIILGGHVLAGDSGNAGHIGQLQLAARKAGQTSAASSLENLAAGPHTVTWAQSQGWTGATGEDLAADYAACVPVAIKAVRRSTTAVGEAIASAASLLDLRHVAIGGGFANVAPDYIELVLATIHECAILDYARAVAVTRSGLSGEGPLIGAGALVHRRDLL